MQHLHFHVLHVGQSIYTKKGINKFRSTIIIYSCETKSYISLLDECTTQVQEIHTCIQRFMQFAKHSDFSCETVLYRYLIILPNIN